MNFENLDPNNHDDQIFGFRLMITFLVAKLGGDVQISQAEISDIVNSGIFANISKGEGANGESTLRFTLPTVEDAEEAFARAFLLSLGIPEADVDAAVKAALAS